MEEFLSLTNQFLIAMPMLADPHFHQSVIYVCEHTKEGAVGLIINRPLDMRLSQIFEQMNIESSITAINQTQVLYGGPVQPDRGFVLHRPRGAWRSSLETTDELTVTTSQDILAAIARGEGPEEFLVTLGCAGWGSTQLEEEYKQNSWLSCKCDTNIIFHVPMGEKWTSAALLLGVDLRLLSTDTGHA